MIFKKYKNCLTVILITSFCFGVSDISYAANCSTTISPYSLSCSISSNGASFTGGSLIIESNVIVTNNSTFFPDGKFTLPMNFINNGIIQSPQSSTNTNSLIGTTFGLNTFENNGSLISNNIGGVYINATGSTVANFINNGSIIRNSNFEAIRNRGTIDNFTNNLIISGGVGIQNTTQGVITTLTNIGTIEGGILNRYNSTSPQFDGLITTLNNLQGASNIPLNYSGKLPINYNIIINSNTEYGKLDVTGGVGLTNFNIASGSNVSNITYPSVLKGLSSSNLTTTSGIFGSSVWTLKEVVSNTWDLLLSPLIAAVAGPSSADTQKSLENIANGLRNTLIIQNSAISNSLNYDCKVFNNKKICLSIGARNTTTSFNNSLNDTSGIIVGAYQPHPKIRFGLYVDQNSQINNVDNSINLLNNKPIVGLFAAWNQNQDGSGMEVKLSAANGQKNAKIIRPIIDTSEPGSGVSRLTSQGLQITAKYGFVVKKKTTITPYVGMRFNENKIAKYTEADSNEVTTPLSYSAIYSNATTLLAGLEISHKFNSRFSLFASANIESDTNATNGIYSATGINGLSTINLNSNPIKTRRFASAGAYFDIADNQRISVVGVYRQESSQALSTTTAIATYNIGM